MSVPKTKLPPIVDLLAHPEEPLRQMMDIVVQFAGKRYQQFKDNEDHHSILHATASEFSLYDEKDGAPVWLSRVVEGIIRDVDNGEF